jgi:hypothetical protein
MVVNQECLGLCQASRKEQTMVKNDPMVEKKLNLPRVMKVNVRRQNRTMMRKRMWLMTSTLRVNCRGVHSRKVVINTVTHNATILNLVEVTGTTLRVEVAVVTTMMSMVNLMAKQTLWITSSWSLCKLKMVFKKEITVLLWVAGQLLIMKKKKLVKVYQPPQEACNKKIIVYKSRKRKKLAITKALKWALTLEWTTKTYLKISLENNNTWEKMTMIA